MEEMTAYELEQFMLRNHFDEGESALVREIAHVGQHHGNHLALELMKKKHNGKAGDSI